MAESKCLSQRKQKNSTKSLNQVNQEFFKENSTDKYVCIDQTSSSVQEISNYSVSKTLKSHDFNSRKILKLEEYCPAYKCDKFDSVFVDVGCDIVGSDYLLEEDDDISKVSIETLFADDKGIDYHLVKNINIEQDVAVSSKENETNVQNLDTTNINDTCTKSDRPYLSKNDKVENVFEKLDSHDKKPNSNVDYIQPSKVVIASADFVKINRNVKEEEETEDELVPQNTENIYPKIKEEIVNDDQVSIINESVIDIELHPVSKIEELADSGNNMHGLDGSCSVELPDNSNEAIETKNVLIVHKALKASEAVQREMETNLKVQNEVQTQNLRLQSDLQIKLDINSSDSSAAFEGGECVNKFCMADQNMEMKNKYDEKSQNRRNGKPEHTTDRHFVCKVCNKTFRHLPTLKAHSHVHTGERPFVCSVCNKAYKQLNHLISHKRIHTGDRPFVCSICGKAFTERGILKKHQPTHTGEKPFSCSMCGKAFAQRGNLKVHYRIHTGDRPHSCSICGKAFTHLSHLKGHQRIHTGEKPVGCSACDARFKDVTSLRKHIRTHTGEKPFLCSICGKAYAQLFSLKKHKCFPTVVKKTETFGEQIEPVYHLQESTSQTMLTQCTQMNIAHCGTSGVYSLIYIPTIYVFNNISNSNYTT